MKSAICPHLQTTPKDYLFSASPPVPLMLINKPYHPCLEFECLLRRLDKKPS